MRRIALVLSIAAVLAAGTATHKCTCGSQPPVPMAESGPEEWSFEGRAYRIARTFYIVTGVRSVAYIIEYHVNDGTRLFGLQDDGALAIAFPLMLHAYRTGAYQRVELMSLRGSDRAKVSIGVDLIGTVSGEERRYRIIRSIGEIVGISNRDGGLEGGAPGL